VCSATHFGNDSRACANGLKIEVREEEFQDVSEAHERRVVKRGAEAPERSRTPPSCSNMRWTLCSVDAETGSKGS
jgi:hypothetical protein